MHSAITRNFKTCIRNRLRVKQPRLVTANANRQYVFPISKGATLLSRSITNDGQKLQRREVSSEPLLWERRMLETEHGVYQALPTEKSYEWLAMLLANDKFKDTPYVLQRNVVPLYLWATMYEPNKTTIIPHSSNYMLVWFSNMIRHLPHRTIHWTEGIVSMIDARKQCGDISDAEVEDLYRNLVVALRLSHVVDSNYAVQMMSIDERIPEHLRREFRETCQDKEFFLDWRTWSTSQNGVGLDICWAHFFSSRSKDGIIEIIKQLGGMHDKDPMNRMASMNAEWSLEANCRDYPTVLRICQEELEMMLMGPIDPTNTNHRYLQQYQTLKNIIERVQSKKTTTQHKYSLIMTEFNVHFKHRMDSLYSNQMKETPVTEVVLDKTGEKIVGKEGDQYKLNRVFIREVERIYAIAKNWPPTFESDEQRQETVCIIQKLIQAAHMFHATFKDTNYSRLVAALFYAAYNLDMPEALIDPNVRTVDNIRANHWFLCALDFTPNDTELLCDYAAFLASLGTQETLYALGPLERAMDLGSDEAVYIMGMALIQLEAVEDGLRYLRKYAEKHPHIKPTIEQLEKNTPRIEYTPFGNQKQMK